MLQTSRVESSFDQNQTRLENSSRVESSQKIIILLTRLDSTWLEFNSNRVEFNLTINSTRLDLNWAQILTRFNSTRYLTRVNSIRFRALDQFSSVQFESDQNQISSNSIQSKLNWSDSSGSNLKIKYYKNYFQNVNNFYQNHEWK